MLFSNPTVAVYINRNYESTWESVRPAVTVNIDFGNGNKIRRTLNGNIVTYICNSQGEVLDVIPGLYKPETYLKRLQQGLLLSRWFTNQNKQAESFLKSYHDQQAQMLEGKQPAKVIVSRGVSITGQERGLKLVLSSSSQAKSAADSLKARTGRGPQRTTKESTTELKPEEESLLQDTEINETVRSLQIHQHLAEIGLLKPKQITKWVYREVMKTDLDDPYLGLGKILFDNYPFREQDATPRKQ